MFRSTIVAALLCVSVAAQHPVDVSPCDGCALDWGTYDASQFFIGSFLGHPYMALQFTPGIGTASGECKGTAPDCSPSGCTFERGSFTITAPGTNTGDVKVYGLPPGPDPRAAVPAGGSASFPVRMPSTPLKCNGVPLDLLEVHYGATVDTIAIRCTLCR